MNKILFFSITLLFGLRLYAQAGPAKYVAATAKFKKYYNAGKPDSIFTGFSAEMKAVLPEEKFRATTTQLKDELGPLLSTEFVKYESPLAVYKATFKNGTFLLNVSLNGRDQYTGLLLSPYQASTMQDPGVTESPIALKTLVGTISGTLALPKGKTEKMPLVIIVPGFGNINRDGNGPKMDNNVYKFLAADLAKKGIASVRYDKRMVGESMISTSDKKKAEVRFDDLFDDVFSIISLLSDDKRFSKIIILGHGQGSLVGMLAAVDDNVKAFISVEGTGDRADAVLTALVKKTYPQYIVDDFKQTLDSLRRGRINKKVDPTLYPIAKPDIQMAILGWWRFDPQAEIKKVKKPVLIINGSTDLDVDVVNAEKLRKNKTNVVAIINGMNYVLKDAPADKEKNQATYTNPELPIKPELISTIVDFVNKLP